MKIYIFIFIITCMLIYTIYAIWQISKFKHLISGIFGTVAVIAGGVGVYYISPIIAVLTTLLFEL